MRSSFACKNITLSGPCTTLLVAFAIRQSETEIQIDDRLGPFYEDCLNLVAVVDQL